MIKLRRLNYNHSDVQAIYLLKSEISRMARNKTENITYITMKSKDSPSYDVLETPEEILAMPDIEETNKVIDWEQRRYEIAKHLLPRVFVFGEHKYSAKYAVSYADALIKELKKGGEKCIQ